MKRWIDRGPKWIRREPVEHKPYQPGLEVVLAEYRGAPVAPWRWTDRARKRR
ncbi:MULTISPECIES: hypothetical protein [unclassified Thermus]|jgi:hypothetical protein|uniref:hypothetical protein n=1 Tax=unclassified Thermus TaxID=2619321 RepID=UPI0025FC3216|nr:hypothetical protein [Thermus sp.]MCS6867713.1 hypothetical protein [Thermus sp.]MCX7850212.1 hypothetical protein [Thermus sp.]MDW8017227.1 hypothetical protein [Thermus sp.]MDW8357605.1 hypothetical protein [Thermus sp.]